MTRHHLPLPLAALLLIPSLLTAQPVDEREDLFVPPVLSVALSRTNSRDTTPIAPDRLDLHVSVQGLSTPLLPMIFFDQGSSVIPERYVLFGGPSRADDFSEQEEISMTMLFNPYMAYGIFDHGDWEERARRGTGDLTVKYYEILNVIGGRMRRHPATSISVRGEYSSEPGEDEAIAAERAAVVRDYLVSIWRIAPERIALLPAQRGAESEANLFHQQEARRVVIDAESWEIHRPIHFRHVRFEQPILYLDVALDAKAEAAEVVGVDLVATAAGRTIASASLPTTASITQGWKIIWAVPLAYEEMPSSIDFHATLRLTNGRSRRSNGVSFPVTFDLEEWGATEWEHLRRITELHPVLFFDAGDTTLSRLARRMINDLLPVVERRLSTQGGSRPIVTLRPFSEEGECPDADVAMMPFIADSARPLALLGKQSESFSAIPSTNTFFVMPERMSGRDEGNEMLGRMFWDLYRVDIDAYSDHMSDIESASARERRSELRGPSHRHDAGGLRHLLAARTENVLAYVHTRIDTSLHVTMMTAPYFDLYPAELLPLPEQRFHRRQVRFILPDDPSLKPNWEVFESNVPPADSP